MRRREFLSLTAATGAAAAFPRLALAQQAKLPHIIYLYRAPPTDFIFTYLSPGLADFGLVIGRDLTVDAVWAPTDADLPNYAARVVAMQPDLIITTATAPALALKHATKTIPVIFFGVGDPVAIGLVLSLAHPGGNMTGFTNLSANFIGKQLSLLQELLPSVTRIVVPYFPANPTTSLFLTQLQPGAAKLGLEPVLVELTQDQDYRVQFDRVLAAGAPAVLQISYGELNNAPTYDLMCDVYARAGVPVHSSQPFHPGWATPVYGLVHYASNLDEIQRRRVPGMVLAILNGAKPADVPVELPTTFDVAVNTWLAKQIGVTIPTDILAQATLVIDYDIRAPKAGAQ